MSPKNNCEKEMYSGSYLDFFLGQLPAEIQLKVTFSMDKGALVVHKLLILKVVRKHLRSVQDVEIWHDDYSIFNNTLPYTATGLTFVGPERWVDSASEQKGITF